LDNKIHVQASKTSHNALKIAKNNELQTNTKQQNKIMKVKWYQDVWAEDLYEESVSGGACIEEQEMTGEVIGQFRTFFGRHMFVVAADNGQVYEVRSSKCSIVSENDSLVVKFKKLRDDAVMPTYAHDTDAGMDLVATSKSEDEHGNIVYGFGLAFEIPEGYFGAIFPRSSNHKHSLLLSNCVGVVDSGYRGEVKAKFRKDYQHKNGFGLVHDVSAEYEVGNKIAQLIIMPYPKIEWVAADELSDSERGAGGYGTTGA
jgi:dUTP pyrophosphatase